MKPADVIQAMQALDPDKEILCQVVAQDGKAWNMNFEFCRVPHVSFNILTVSHPELKTLPEIPS